MTKEQFLALMNGPDGKLVGKRCNERYLSKHGLLDYVLENAPADFLSIGDKIRFIKYGGGHCLTCGVRTAMAASGQGFGKYCKDHYHDPKRGKTAHNRKDLDLEKIIEMYESGMSIWDISQTLGNVSNVSISKKLKASGYEIRSHSDNQKMMKHKSSKIEEVCSKDYLNESKLVNFCIELWPDDDYTSNKQIKGMSEAWRPDYVNLTKKIIVEFDGHLHYTQAKTCLLDEYKDVAWTKQGFKVIRWPYFVQLSSASIQQFFSFEQSYHQVYPHGFIDANVIYPADFCIAGLKRFVNELSLFHESISMDIYNSLEVANNNSRWGGFDVYPDLDSIEHILNRRTQLTKRGPKPPN